MRRSHSTTWKTKTRCYSRSPRSSESTTKASRNSGKCRSRKECRELRGDRSTVVRTLGSIPALDTRKSSRCPILCRRLMASAVARLSTTEKLRKRSHADRPLSLRDAIARLILSREPAAAIPSDALSVQPARSTSRIAMITRSSASPTNTWYDVYTSVLILGGQQWGP
jgi:hypothetical protein